MTDDGDEGCLADYGVFGWHTCNCSVCNPAPRKRDPERERQTRLWDQQRERERQASSNFNRYMIDLYNQRNKP